MVKPNRPGSDGTGNESFYDAMIRHQIDLMRFSEGVQRDVVKALRLSEKGIKSAILLGLSEIETDAVSRRLKAVPSIMAEIRAVTKEPHEEAKRHIEGAAAGLIGAEVDFVKAKVASSLPVKIDFTSPRIDAIKAIVESQPMQGMTAAEWMASLTASDIHRIERLIKIGVIQGEPTPDIARSVVGELKEKGLVGVRGKTYREAQTMVRTVVSHTTRVVRDELNKRNADIISKELYVATLDGRTTAICRSLDGKQFKINEGPRPPVHWACRSLRVAVFDDKVIGDRPMKPVTERMLAREFAKKYGLEGVSHRGDLPRGYKAKFDTFSRSRVREMVGRAPSNLSYSEWFKKQSAEFQDDVLGRTKGTLYRRGGLKLDKFVHQNGRELSLSDLAKRNKEAFELAGLDPDQFSD